MPVKVVCKERHCGWSGDLSQLLSAPDPFNKEFTLLACPKCKTVENSIVTACGYADCTEPATGGYPVAKGYTQRCHKHRPTLEELR